jgi:hypothetical protein
MSQKPYVYDRNNPVSYSDPSGFLVEFQDAYVQTVSSSIKSHTYQTWLAALNTDSHIWVMKAGNFGKGGLIEFDSRTITIDTSQKLGVIKGQLAHEVLHGYHCTQDCDKATSDSHKPMSCPGCPKTVKAQDANGHPIDVNGETTSAEEARTFVDAAQVTAEDSSVSWIGPPWGTNGDTLSLEELEQWLGIGKTNPFSDVKGGSDVNTCVDCAQPH